MMKMWKFDKWCDFFFLCFNDVVIIIGMVMELCLIMIVIHVK
jgi:hypothetical protein